MAGEENNQKLAHKQKLALLEDAITDASGLRKQILEAEVGLLKIQNKLKEDQSDTVAKAVNAQEEVVEKLKEELKLREQSREIGKNRADQIIKINSLLLDQLSTAESMGQAFSIVGDQIKGQLSQFASFQKVAFMAIDKIAGSTIAAVSALDDAGASFVQSTGASRDFARAAFETRDSLGLMGITGAEAVETMGSLYAGFSEFTELSEASQQSFTEFATQINKLGGNAEGMSQVFTKVAGMSITQTTESMRLLHGAADALGIPFSQVSNDLIGMGDLFGKMGDAGMEVFLGLQAAAKATGMSVQDLYGIVGKYDTFESATQAAGRLNMVLGGNLIDTYSLLNATEEERIELLQEAMEQSSMTFDDMDKWQKMEVASALNISLEEASQLFGTTSDEVQRTAQQLMYAGETQEELTARTLAAATATDKLKVLMGNLAIAVGPIVEKINWMIDGFLEFSAGMGSTKAALTILAAGLISSLVAFTLFGAGIGITFGTAAAVISSTAAPISAGLAAMGVASGGASIGMAMFSGAVLALGGGVAIAAYGLSLLVASFKDLDPESVLASGGALTAFSAAAASLGFSSLLGAGVPRYIRQIAAALNDIPDNTEKMLAFKTTTESLASLMQIGSSVEAEQLERIKMIIDAVSNVEGAESTNRLAAAINSLARGQANNEGATNVIELDGKVLAKWLDKHEQTRFRKVIG